METNEITRILLTMDRNFQDRLNEWWAYAEERRQRNARLAVAVLVAVLLLCGVVAWQDRRLFRLERDLKVVQEKCGVETTDAYSAGIW